MSAVDHAVAPVAPADLGDAGVELWESLLEERRARAVRTAEYNVSTTEYDFASRENVERPDGDVLAERAELTRKEFALTVRDREQLVHTCRAADLVADLEAILRAEGLLATGSTGQVKAHPAVAELRAARAELRLLLSGGR